MPTTKHALYRRLAMYYMKKKTDDKKRVTISTNKIKFYENGIRVIMVEISNLDDLEIYVLLHDMGYIQECYKDADGKTYGTKDW